MTTTQNNPRPGDLDDDRASDRADSAADDRAAGDSAVFVNAGNAAVGAAGVERPDRRHLDDDADDADDDDDEDADDEDDEDEDEDDDREAATSPSTEGAPGSGQRARSDRPPVFDLDMEALERICTVSQIRGSGPGGQHRNKAYTGVRLFHPPSGLVVTATERRSFQQNRANAFERLIERLQNLMHRDKPRKETRIPRAVKRKRLENKKKRADTKKARGRIEDW